MPAVRTRRPVTGWEALTDAERRVAQLVAGGLANREVAERLFLSRYTVLGRLCAALRPGGVLLVEEHDAFPVWAAATGAYRDAWLAFHRACRAAGVDPDWARDLPLRLGRHGLADVDAELDVPLFRGGSAQAQFWSLTWQQVRGRAVAVGEPAHVIDRGRVDLGDEQRWFRGPAMVITWAGACQSEVLGSPAASDVPAASAAAGQVVSNS